MLFKTEITFLIIMVYFQTHTGSYKLLYNVEGKTTQEYMKGAENLRFNPLELCHSSLSLDNHEELSSQADHYNVSQVH